MNPILKMPEPVTNRATVSKSYGEPAASSADSRRRTVYESRTRILYVDDDQAVRGLGAEVLTRSGYEVDTVNDGAEAWAALQDREYHLLITDNQMPRITGLELIRRISIARLTIPIILASGTVGGLPVSDLPWLRCAAMLAKPFTPEQLVSIVHEVLRVSLSTKTSPGVRLPVMEEFHSHVEPCQDWGINE